MYRTSGVRGCGRGVRGSFVILLSVSTRPVDHCIEWRLRATHANHRQIVGCRQIVLHFPLIGPRCSCSPGDIAIRKIHRHRLNVHLRRSAARQHAPACQNQPAIAMNDDDRLAGGFGQRSREVERVVDGHGFQVNNSACFSTGCGSGGNSLPWSSSLSRRRAAISQYFSSISTPIALRPRRTDRKSVVPLPAKGSRIVLAVHFPSNSTINEIGFCVGCSLNSSTVSKFGDTALKDNTLLPRWPEKRRPIT